MRGRDVRKVLCKEITDFFVTCEALFSCISYLSPGLSSPQLLLGDLIDRTGQGKNSVIRTSILPKLCSTLVDWPLQQQFLHFLTQHIQSGEHAMGEQEPEG